MPNKKKQVKIKAWIIDDGRWATNQMLIFQTKKSAEERIYFGGKKGFWKVRPCTISYQINSPLSKSGRGKK